MRSCPQCWIILLNLSVLTRMFFLSLIGFERSLRMRMFLKGFNNCLQGRSTMHPVVSKIVDLLESKTIN